MICQFIVRLTDECSCGRRIYLFKERLYQHAQHIVSVCQKATHHHRNGEEVKA